MTAGCQGRPGVKRTDFPTLKKIDALIGTDQKLSNVMALMKTAKVMGPGLLLLLLSTLSCAGAPKNSGNALPKFMLGEFEDDYGAEYRIDEKLFHLLPNDRYHILSVNQAEGYLVLQNDSLNTYAPSLFTRIDYQRLKKMKPYEWAFCYSSYEAANVQDAIKNVNTQKADLRTGCNGFPFSRMKRDKGVE
jgi:hypothetical protein